MGGGDLPERQQRFLERCKTLAERLDFELADEAKDDLVGYLVHWASETFGVVVKEGKRLPRGIPCALDGEYVNVIHSRHTGQLKPGYVVIMCRYQRET